MEGDFDLGISARHIYHIGAGIELSQIVLGLMCPGRLYRGGKSQNEAKSRRFGIDRPSRAFYEGVNPKTILNNCPESTGRHIGQFLTSHVRTLFRSYEVPFLDCGECGKKAGRDDVRHFVLCRFILSASFSVKAAGGTGREVFRQEFFSVEADSAFLSKEAGYPYGPACFDGAEGRG